MAACGRVDRVPGELTDAEIVLLLADSEPGHEIEKRALAEEAERRMARARGHDGFAGPRLNGPRME